MPMSKNLLEGGFQLTVNHRSQGIVEEMAGLGATQPHPQRRLLKHRI